MGSTAVTKAGVMKERADFTPSTDVWFSDGGVVLVAQTTAFRVHGSIIAAQCEVFKDMFAMPQPADPDADSERYEGCQVVGLQDSAADLRHFLKTIYDFRYMRPGAKSKFPVVAAVLKLSIKYDAPELRQRALHLLDTAYPSTLTAWDLRSSDRLVPPFEGEFGACLTLAIQSDIRAILPAVYYAASRQPLSEVLDELRSPSLALAPDAQWDVCTAFLLGREQLERAELKYILGFFAPTFHRPNCQNCSRDTDALSVAAKNAARKVAGMESFLRWCDQDPGKVGNSLGLCERCCETVAKSIQEGRQKVWEQLPGFFGLPGWATLRARDELE